MYRERAREREKERKEEEKEKFDVDRPNGRVDKHCQQSQSLYKGHTERHLGNYPHISIFRPFPPEWFWPWGHSLSLSPWKIQPMSLSLLTLRRNCCHCLHLTHKLKLNTELELSVSKNRFIVSRSFSSFLFLTIQFNFSPFITWSHGLPSIVGWLTDVDPLGNFDDVTNMSEIKKKCRKKGGTFFIHYPLPLLFNLPVWALWLWPLYSSSHVNFNCE